MSRLARSAGLLGLAVLLGGCQTDAAKQAESAGEVAAEPTPKPIPTTEAEFLAELLPIPGDADAIAITYAVTGPALEGEMTILVREGGYRREQWELRTTGSPTELRSAGLAIANPSQIWHAPEGQAGELRVNQLGALASAWTKLAEPERAAVVTTARDWQRLLDQRRTEVPGDRGEILDIPCLQLRIAAQNLCMWEEVGLFLRYEGSAFTIEATQIDREPMIPADAFVLPAVARDAAKQAALGTSADVAGALDKAAHGNFADLFLLITQSRTLPELELPSDAGDPAAPPHPAHGPNLE